MSAGRNEDARWQAGTKGQSTTDASSITHSGGTCLDKTAAERKELETTQAKAAMASCGLHELASGGFLLTRWGLSRELPDLRAVAALLAQIGGVR